MRLGRCRDEDPDVDRSIDQRAPRLWEPPGARTRLITRVIPTDASFDAALAGALAALREFGLET